MSISSFEKTLRQLFDIRLVSNANDNPLFFATDLSNVIQELLLCPDKVTNSHYLNTNGQFYEFINKYDVL